VQKKLRSRLGFSSWTLLHVAASEGNFTIVQLLLDSGADINHQEHNGWTSLHLAVLKSHLDVVKLLLARGANIMLPTKGDSWAPIHTASRLTPLIKSPKCKGKKANKKVVERNKHCYEVLDLLLQHCSDINVKTKSGLTPLDLALINQNEAVTKKLVEMHAVSHKYNASNPQGQSWLLHNASRDRNLAAINIIGPQMKHVNITKGAKNWTALHVACFGGDVAAVKALLKIGVDAMLQDRLGQTALHLACKRRSKGIVVTLIHHYGEELAQVTDEFGRRAESYASRALQRRINNALYQSYKYPLSLRRVSNPDYHTRHHSKRSKCKRSYIQKSWYRRQYKYLLFEN